MSSITCKLLLTVFLLSPYLAQAINTHQFEEIEFHYLNKADSKNWKQVEVSFGYKNEPVSKIVKRILKPTGKEIIGIEALASRHRSVLMTKIKAFKAVNILLRCEGYKMIDTKSSIKIVFDSSINREACLY